MLLPLGFLVCNFVFLKWLAYNLNCTFLKTKVVVDFKMYAKFKRNLMLSIYKIYLQVLDTITPQLLQSLPEITVSYSSKQLPENVEDIDKEDSGNPQLVSVYVKDIYVYLRELEV